MKYFISVFSFYSETFFQKYNFKVNIQICMDIKKLAFFVLLTVYILGKAPQEIIIEYQSMPHLNMSQLKYFYDVEDGYFLDMGGFNPIYISLSRPLLSMGWNGITVEPNPTRARNFYEQRSDQTVLNVAGGQDSKMVTLYEFERGGRATISKQVKDQKKDVSIGSVQVPTLSMKAICERYFFKKVNFMTIDVEGVASMVFQSNDWSNPICRPEFIIVQDNKLNRFSGQKPIPQVLTENGYVHIGKVRTNAVWVLKEKESYFRKKEKEGIAYYNTKKKVNFGPVQKEINKIYQTKIQYYQASTSPFYYYFSNKKPIFIREVSKMSNLLGQTHKVQDRSIFIFHYNPHKTSIFIDDPNYKIKETKIGEYSFHQITLLNERNRLIEVFVFNHFFSPLIEPSIVLVSANQSPLTVSSQIQNRNENTNQNTNTNTNTNQNTNEISSLYANDIKSSVISQFRQQMYTFQKDNEDLTSQVIQNNDENSKSVNSEVESLRKQLDTMYEMMIILIFLFLAFIISFGVAYLLRSKNTKKHFEIVEKSESDTNVNPL